MAWPGSWPSHALTQSRERLVELRNTVNELPSTTPSATEGALSRFLVVRACGHIEFTFDEAFCSFAESKSSPAIASFVRSQFFRGSNPSAERLSQTLRKLDETRAERFTAFVEDHDGELQRELSFLLDRRNKIAHGQSESVGRVKAIALSNVSLRLADWLLDELDPR